MPEVNLRQILSADLKRSRIKKLEPITKNFSFFTKVIILSCDDYTGTIKAIKNLPAE